jgi:hypothetical protein
VDGLGWRPSELLLGVDLEAFHNNLEPDPRLLSNSKLGAYLPAGMKLKSLKVMFESLVSMETLKQSVRSLWYSAKGYPPDSFTTDSDGLMHDVRADREIAENRFVPDIRVSFKEYCGRFAGFTELDPNRLELFNDLIGYADAHGMKVRAFLTPLHPALVNELRQCSNYDSVHEKAVKAMAGFAGPVMSWTDLSGIALFGGDASMFIDGAHMRRENTVRLLKVLYASGAGGRPAI